MAHDDRRQESNTPPPDFPPIDPPDDHDDHNFRRRPERIDVAISPKMWEALRWMMEHAGVDVEAALTDAHRPDDLDKDTAYAWQLDAAFHHLGLTGAQVHEGARVNDEILVMRDSDGTESEIIVL